MKFWAAILPLDAFVPRFVHPEAPGSNLVSEYHQWSFLDQFLQSNYHSRKRMSRCWNINTKGQHNVKVKYFLLPLNFLFVFLKFWFPWTICRIILLGFVTGNCIKDCILEELTYEHIVFLKNGPFPASFLFILVFSI